MAKAKKTRFFVEVLGKPQELFAVTELASGDLSILVRRALQIGADFGPYSDHEEQRFSAHLSPDSPGFTITQHLKAVDGPPVTASSFFTPSDDGVIWPLYFFMCPDLSANHYNMPERAKDRAVFVGKYDTNFFTFIYIVVITDHASANLINPFDAFETTRADFKGFSVTVLHCLMRTPSLPRGHFSAVVTSSPTTGGATPIWRSEGGRPSFSTDELQESARHQLEFMSHLYLANLNRLAPDLDDEAWRNLVDLAFQFVLTSDDLIEVPIQNDL